MDANSTAPILDYLMNFGAAGLMGMMWLFERRNSVKRDTQLDEAQTRILADKLQVEALMTLVRQNTEALTRLDTFLRTGALLASKAGAQ